MKLILLLSHESKQLSHSVWFTVSFSAAFTGVQPDSLAVTLVAVTLEIAWPHDNYLPRQGGKWP